MNDPRIRTKVVHSQSKSAYNVVGEELGKKYKIARILYMVSDDSKQLTDENKRQALHHAQFISQCFNHSSEIIGKIF